MRENVRTIIVALTAVALSVSVSVFAQAPVPSPQQPPSQQQLPMQTGNPLAELRPIHLPDEPSGWPAPGWYLLTLLILGLIIAAILYWRKHRQSKVYLNKQQSQWALKELKRYSRDNKADYIRQCNALLKRVAMANYPSENPAQLSDEQWLQFLTRHCESLDSQVFNILKQGPYLPDEKLQAISTEPLAQACQHWLSHHHEVTHA
ncbi:DUF4381 domain-containing protein [Pseudoteredinibacter isoporae]|uniref:DUF4381 domain-containing protein n=1 Tax=Pseudoteredinibacter isoporae TaxID=570281 RepID=A0A7X0JSW1_9GAMM|nr:DUF4381 domain-containing protein [Pseudoteredinibacter isoporae]MBB6521634.1 hypothetical protein [Pseudoteredinibacter isoporae]NHO87188.1 DUF4381 domain-containing protein [Pseudoteredinibacter isoporae]NIB23012.1 DUF4381 domain-containing protein [Pseudoteredinibacter isoporae]